MLTNSTQWQDLPAQNEPGSSISGFYDNCKKGIHSSIKIAALLSISQADGNLRQTENNQFNRQKRDGTVKNKGETRFTFLPNQPNKTGEIGKTCRWCIRSILHWCWQQEYTEPSGNTIGLDVGAKKYYTDSNGVMVENSRFLRQGEKVLKRSHEIVSRKIKGSKNRGKARQILGLRHLKISRQSYCMMQ